MNVKTIVECTADSIYLGWRDELEVTDSEGNTVTIKLTAEQIADLAETATRKVKEHKEKQLEKLREELEELENESC